MFARLLLALYSAFVESIKEEKLRQITVAPKAVDVFKDHGADDLLSTKF